MRYFDPSNVISVANAYFGAWERGKPVSKGLILHGPPGVGKTLLVHEVAKSRHYALKEVNASDSRKAGDIVPLRKASLMKPIEGSLLVIFLDEADSMTKSAYRQVEKMLKIALNPVVLAVNEFYDVPGYIRDVCWDIQFPRPETADKRRFLRWLAKDGGYTIPDEKAALIAQRAANFRDAESMMKVYLVTKAILPAREPDLDVRGQIEVFTSKPCYEPSISPPDLLIWIADNSANYGLVSAADEMLGFTPQSRNLLSSVEKTYAMWPYVRHILSLAKVSEVEYPRTWRLLAERKRKKKESQKEEKRTKREPKRTSSRTSSQAETAPSGQVRVTDFL